MAIQVQTQKHNSWWMRWLTPSFAVLREHKRAYIALNVFYYAFIVCGMLYAALNPDLQQTVLQSVGTAFSQGPLAAVTDAYVGAEILPAILLTFIVNLFVGSFGSITLPSLIIPFSGLLMGVYRAFLWGLIYSPTTPQMQMILLPHSITLLLEGQAYVLTMLAVVLQGRGLVSPRTLGATTRKQALRDGLGITLRLYILVTLVLIIAAVYEVAEAMFLLNAQ